MNDLQYKILIGLASGKTITQIALDLNYSRDWVSRQSAKLYKELGARNAPNAVAIAIRRGLID